MKKILHGRIHPNSSVCTEGPDPARPSTDGSHQAHKGPSCLGAQHFHRFRNQIFSGETTKEFDELELELELIQTQMAQKPMLRAEVGMRVRCANKASAE